MIWKTYIGPLPERPVTASSWYSGSSTTMPIDSKIFRASRHRCAAVACLPGAEHRGREPHDRRHVRHRAHDGDARRPSDRLDARRRKPGRDRDDELLARDDRLDLGEHAVEDLRLDGEDHDVGRARRLAVRRARRGCRAPCAAPRPSRPSDARRSAGPCGPSPTPRIPRSRAAAHVAGAEHGDRLVRPSGKNSAPAGGFLT